MVVFSLDNKRRNKLKYLKYISILIISLLLMSSQCASNNNVNNISISGIWEGRKDGVIFFIKGKFSWGKNVFSTSSVIIDLNDEEEGPYIGTHAGGTFLIQETQIQGNNITLIGFYYDKPNEQKRILITIIDENTITIDLEGKPNTWLDRHEDSNVFHRVPVNAPYTPIGPEGI